MFLARPARLLISERHGHCRPQMLMRIGGWCCGNMRSFGTLTLAGKGNIQVHCLKMRRNN